MIDLIFIFLTLVCLSILLTHNSEYFFIKDTKYDNKKITSIYNKYRIRKSLGQIKETARNPN